MLEEECGHEVLVANARKLRLIYASKRKTDEIDAENLARLARLDPKLLYPLKHRSEDSQAHLAIIRSRAMRWSVARTQLVNHVRGAVKSFGGSIEGDCAMRTWSIRQEQRPLGRLQRLCVARIKTDLILCTEPPKSVSSLRVRIEA